MTQKEIFTKILAHFITVAEIQNLMFQKNACVEKQDYQKASEIHQDQKLKEKELLPLNQMKEYHQILLSGGE